MVFPGTEVLAQQSPGIAFIVGICSSIRFEFMNQRQLFTDKKQGKNGVEKAQQQFHQQLIVMMTVL